MSHLLESKARATGFLSNATVEEIAPGWLHVQAESTHKRFEFAAYQAGEGQVSLHYFSEGPIYDSATDERGEENGRIDIDAEGCPLIYSAFSGVYEGVWKAKAVLHFESGPSLP